DLAADVESSRVPRFANCVSDYPRFFMATLETGTWAERIQQTLARYDEPLLRQVSDNLFRPRNQWPADELVARGIATVGNAAAVDRKLRVLEPGCRCLLALIAHSRQPRWRVGSLLEMLAVL